MEYLIDTHVLIWYINGDEALPDKYVELMVNPENKLYVSMISIWEITIKMGLNKLQLNTSIKQIEKYILDRDFDVLNVYFDHLNKLSTLPQHHRDPFDRLIISQAISENLTIISADQHFRAYPVSVIW